MSAMEFLAGESSMFLLGREVCSSAKVWATLLHFIYFYYLLLVTNYPITILFVTYYFSACREYLAENRLSFPSAPRWVRHSYLRKDYDRSPILVGHHSPNGTHVILHLHTHVGPQLRIDRRHTPRPRKSGDLIEEGDEH